MKSHRLLVFLLIFGVCFSAFSQTIPNVAGEWNGTSSYLKKTFKVELQLKQNGNKLTGVLIQKTLKEKDSLMATYSGSIKDGFVRLAPQKIEYATGILCAGNFTMELKEPNKLSGTRKGDWKEITCEQGVGGPINLFRGEAKQD